MDLDMARRLDQVSRWKRSIDPGANWSICIMIGSLPPPLIYSSKLERASHSFIAIALLIQAPWRGDRRPIRSRGPPKPSYPLGWRWTKASPRACHPLVQVEWGVSPSLAPLAKVSPHQGQPTEVAESSGTTPTSLRLKASTIEDYKLAHGVFTRILFSTNANTLLSKKCSTIQKKAIGCFIQVS